MVSADIKGPLPADFPSFRSIHFETTTIATFAMSKLAGKNIKSQFITFQPLLDEF